MTAFAAAAFENDFIFEKFGFDRLQPAEKLLVVFFVFLRKMRPLPAEIFGSFGFVLLDFRQIGKTRNAAHDLVFTRAFFARQNPFDDFLIFIFARIRQQNIAAAGRASE